MDYKIFIGSSLRPVEKTVSKTDTVRTLLTEMNVPFRDGEVSLNGSILGSSDMNKPLGELGIQDSDYILVTAKQNSGQKGC